MSGVRHRAGPLQPLGRGFLTGQIKRFEDLAEDDYRRQSPRFQGENFQRNMDLLERVSEISREKHCSPGQLALAWVLAQGDDIVPIPGTKRRKYLQENAGALNVNLTSADLARINAVRAAKRLLRAPLPGPDDADGEPLTSCLLGGSLSQSVS